MGSGDGGGNSRVCCWCRGGGSGGGGNSSCGGISDGGCGDIGAVASYAHDTSFSHRKSVSVVRGSSGIGGVGGGGSGGDGNGVGSNGGRFRRKFIRASIFLIRREHDRDLSPISNFVRPHHHFMPFLLLLLPPFALLLLPTVLHSLTVFCAGARRSIPLQRFYSLLLPKVLLSIAAGHVGGQ